LPLTTVAGLSPRAPRATPCEPAVPPRRMNGLARCRKRERPRSASLLTLMMRRARHLLATAPQQAPALGERRRRRRRGRPWWQRGPARRRRRGAAATTRRLPHARQQRLTPRWSWRCNVGGWGGAHRAQAPPVCAFVAERRPAACAPCAQPGGGSQASPASSEQVPPLTDAPCPPLTSHGASIMLQMRLSRPGARGKGGQPS
jgi:hypothetical protein